METCTVSSRHNTFFPNNLHYKSASDGDSPDASMPMGSLASPLVDSGYHEGSLTYNHSESANSSGSLIDESQVVGSCKGPPPITPISGRLERFKQYHMIRPVPLKATSPSRSLDSASNSSRHSLPISPASMPDHVSEQQQQQQHQPPDVILTNQQPAFAGNHFGALPTKCLSLQDIAPKQRNYHDRGSTSPPRSGIKGWGKQPVQPRRIQPAHSLNYLNRNATALNPQLNHKQLLPDYKRRNISQSTSTVDDGRRITNGTPKKPLRVSHSNPSYGHVVMDHNSNRVDGKSSLSSSSQVSSLTEEAEMSEITSLRQKLLEKEAQLNTLRDTMDNNEVAILKVHEDKHKAWEEETSWLRKELQEQEETSKSIRHSLQSQIYKLEQEKKTLREKLDGSRHPRHLPSKETEDFKWQLKNLKDQLSLKNKEVTNLRNKLSIQEHRLSEEVKTVVSLEAELEKIQNGKVKTSQENQEVDKRLLKEKDAELNEARVEADHLKKLKDNLAQEVQVQQEELTLLRTKITSKDKELGQERCEVTYLREVQEKLNQQLQKRGKLSGGLISGIGSSPGNSNNLKEKLAQKEREISHVREQLRRVQDEKEIEVGKLRRNLKERNNEIEKIQKKLSEAEKDCSMLRNKLANGKETGTSKMTPLQRQLESDFMEMQVKLTTREREVFQLKRELVMLKEKSEMDISNLKSKLRHQEHEQKGFQECILQREADIGILTEKVKSQDLAIASLQKELEELASSRKATDLGDSQRRVEELELEITKLEKDREELCIKVMDLSEESAMYKEKLDKISQGVRSLSTSQSNLINLCKGTPTGAGTSPRPAKSEEALQNEVKSLKEELAACRQRLHGQESQIAQERRIWQEEKEKVIKYQKQLQLNYVQMCRRNRSLEGDLQQLTMELEHKEITHC